MEFVLFEVYSAMASNLCDSYDTVHLLCCEIFAIINILSNELQNKVIKKKLSYSIIDCSLNILSEIGFSLHRVPFIDDSSFLYKLMSYIKLS